MDNNNNNNNNNNLPKVDAIRYGDNLPDAKTNAKNPPNAGAGLEDIKEVSQSSEEFISVTVMKEFFEDTKNLDSFIAKIKEILSVEISNMGKKMEKEENLLENDQTSDKEQTSDAPMSPLPYMNNFVVKLEREFNTYQEKYQKTNDEIERQICSEPYIKNMKEMFEQYQMFLSQTTIKTAIEYCNSFINSLQNMFNELSDKTNKLGPYDEKINLRYDFYIYSKKVEKLFADHDGMLKQTIITEKNQRSINELIENIQVLVLGDIEVVKHSGVNYDNTHEKIIQHIENMEQLPKILGEIVCMADINKSLQRTNYVLFSRLEKNFQQFNIVPELQQLILDAIQLMLESIRNKTKICSLKLEKTFLLMGIFKAIEVRVHNKSLNIKIRRNNNVVNISVIFASTRGFLFTQIKLEELKDDMPTNLCFNTELKTATTKLDVEGNVPIPYVWDKSPPIGYFCKKN